MATPTGKADTPTEFRATLPMEIEVCMTVERPAAETFQALESPAAQSKWMESLIEFSLDPGTPWGLGARFTQVLMEAGMRQVFRGEVTAYEVNRRLQLKLEHQDLHLTTEVLLTDLGERTQVVQRSQIELQSTALKIMKGMVKGAIERRFSEDFERLKALLEDGR